MRYFIWDCKSSISLHQFRHKLAMQLIHNDEYENELFGDVSEKRQNKRSRTGTIEHVLFKAPPHARSYHIDTWICNAKDPYQRYVCNGKTCNRRTRTSCSCSPGYWLCHHCHTQHIINEHSINVFTPTNSP